MPGNLPEALPGFHRFLRPVQPFREEAVSEFFAGKFESREFPNPLWMDRETFLGRNLSSSYAPRPDAPQYRPFVEELGALFDRYAENGQLRWNNATRCYSGRL